ncbi:TIGR03862 family flavoprotein [Roseicyclus marinus]|uniref:TIGR03862 family flavoprotein n=1 Tax=Roseicyclus marinus TaxID=2161673 RepID=UPI00241043EB|nr:TIGR03862 family flavoprotein [Roseicyclus marinus]MDG3041077.1 TIGR03862 family flavoprotein [Roseicyclus marinus]
MTGEAGAPDPLDKGAERIDALVIGAGPAGLMAAEVMGRSGRSVVVVEGKPSVGRKFLMAGKSGLNLTKDEASERFLSGYGDAAEWLAPMLADIGPETVKRWAEDLGQPVFTGSSGRVFPVTMKASPLLRAWLGRIGAEVRTHWRWVGWDGQHWLFDTREGQRRIAPRVVLLALGGASWARLGSDGVWAGLLSARGVALAPFRPANMGFVVDWSAHMEPLLGLPVKGVALRDAAGRWHRGEFVVSARGVEGGGIYAVSADLRDGAPLIVDLLPDLSMDEVARRLAARPAKRTLTQHMAKALRLDPVKRALVQEFGRPLPEGEDLARLLKGLEIRHAGPRPMDEAISTSGGVRRQAVDDGLMLRDLPGVFVAGEMLDWEAPTGGYLITGCLATGAWAGRHAAKWES